jgi:hypothetical protein
VCMWGGSGCLEGGCRGVCVWRAGVCVAGVCVGIDCHGSVYANGAEESSWAQQKDDC